MATQVHCHRDPNWMDHRHRICVGICLVRRICRKKKGPCQSLKSPMETKFYVTGVPAQLSHLVRKISPTGTKQAQLGGTTSVMSRGISMKMNNRFERLQKRIRKWESLPKRTVAGHEQHRPGSLKK